MRVVFARRQPGQVEFGLIYGGIALLALWFARSFPVLSFTPPCVFKGFFGVPCPTCGATRSFFHFANGETFTALAFNPFVALSLTAAIVYFLYSLITLAFDFPRIALIISKAEGNALRIVFSGLFLVQWCYLVLTL
jgi:hypothetical protein